MKSCAGSLTAFHTVGSKNWRHGHKAHAAVSGTGSIRAERDAARVDLRARVRAPVRQRGAGGASAAEVSEKIPRQGCVRPLPGVSQIERGHLSSLPLLRGGWGWLRRANPDKPVCVKQWIGSSHALGELSPYAPAAVTDSGESAVGNAKVFGCGTNAAVPSDVLVQIVAWGHSHVTQFALDGDYADCVLECNPCAGQFHSLSDGLRLCR